MADGVKNSNLHKKNLTKKKKYTLEGLKVDEKNVPAIARQSRKSLTYRKKASLWRVY